MALLSRSIDKLTPVESEISKAGGKALSLPTDVGKSRLGGTTARYTACVSSAACKLEKHISDNKVALPCLSPAEGMAK